VTLVGTDVSEELSASFIRVTRIGELGTTLAVTSNRRTLIRSLRRLLVTVSVVPNSPILVTLMKEALSSYETRFLQEPRGVTPQETQFFIVTAVKTSNLTKSFLSIAGLRNRDYAVQEALTVSDGRFVASQILPGLA
jgi:hypothetical protein